MWLVHRYAGVVRFTGTSARNEIGTQRAKALKDSAEGARMREGGREMLQAALASMKPAGREIAPSYQPESDATSQDQATRPTPIDPIAEACGREVTFQKY